MEHVELARLSMPIDSNALTTWGDEVVRRPRGWPGPCGWAVPTRVVDATGRYVVELLDGAGERTAV